MPRKPSESQDDPAADGPVEPLPLGGLGIGAVARMTGVDEHTLRIWERRYGFPKPERSSGGARLYRIEDVRKLRLITQALSRGHRPGEVVAKDVQSLEALLLAGLPELAPVSEDPAAREREQILSALRREDVDGVRSGLRRLAMMLGPRRFVVDVAHPLAIQVGELWASGQIEIHQEHLLSDCLSTQLRLLRSLFEETRGPVLLLTTLPGEPHALGLEMIALYAAVAGAATRVLGVSTPAEQLVLAARAHQAAAVGLAVTPSSNLETTADAVRQIVAALAPATQVWLGGAGAAQLPRIPGARLVIAWPEVDAALLSLGLNGGAG